jgi:hypothetical protein
MAALPPLENVCGIGSLSPAGKCLEAATAPICHHVRRQLGSEHPIGKMTKKLKNVSQMRNFYIFALKNK